MSLSRPDDRPKASPASTMNESLGSQFANLGLTIYDSDVQ